MSVVLQNGRPRRLTQPEKSAATQQALLDSTIETLIELGYDKATTTEISERAGLSRGAHLHHFGTRGVLLAAAARALATRVQQELELAVADLPRGAKRSGAALDVLWKLYTGPLFQAVLELAIHARTDPELSRDLQPVRDLIGAVTPRLLRVAFTGDGNDHSMDDHIALVAASLRGLALLPTLDPDYDPTARWQRLRQQLIKQTADAAASAVARR
jgi:AcrR family transcriptional regulator